MHGASPIYRGLAPCTSVSWVARENSRALMMKRPAQSLSYVGPIAARHSIMLHLMQDLLHWAHKLARNGLVELGCVSRGPENDCKGNWDKKYRRNAWIIQAYVLP